MFRALESYDCDTDVDLKGIDLLNLLRCLETSGGSMKFGQKISNKLVKSKPYQRLKVMKKATFSNVLKDQLADRMNFYLKNYVK